MVQEYGSKSNVISAVPFKENGRASESASKNMSQSKQSSVSKSYSTQKMDNSNAQKYGAWGSFKNKEHFVNMHLF